MKILCYGDSNTYGYDPAAFLGGRYPRENRWPELLAAAAGHEVLNMGLNGREIPHIEFTIEDFREKLLLLAPDLTIVMLGTNDLLNNAGAEKATARMRTLVESFAAHRRENPTARLLLLAPPDFTGEPEDLLRELCSFRAAETALAQEFACEYLDTSLLRLPLAYDGIHLTEPANHILAEALTAYILTGHENLHII